MSVVIETTVGDLTVDLFIDERPLACLNFIKLCKLKYYNYNLFHTIEQDFIAQTGDPTGAGNGGSSVWGVIEGPQKRFFQAETIPKILHTSVGLLSLVSPAKHLVGSQFFFTLGADLTSLDGQHCVIGQVVEGHETLRILNEAIVDEKFRPYQDIRITHTVILDDPFPNMRGFRAPSRSPSPTAERLQNGRIAADEDIDDTEGKSIEELQEMLAEREAKARATILEIVGDLPDAEAAPPENVLFVCKLNPVTTEDDLEIIFSRFGKVVSCEVIRDKKTGDSLQYAFVEFEDQKSCEGAYFKMDNVLIDDRRIHVDFSQSVAKVKWRGKGRGIEGEEGRLDFNNLRSENRNRMTSEERRESRKERHREERERNKGTHSKRENDAEKQNRRYDSIQNNKNSYRQKQYNAHPQSERKRNERRDEHREIHHRVRSRSRERRVESYRHNKYSTQRNNDAHKKKRESSRERNLHTRSNEIRQRGSNNYRQRPREYEPRRRDSKSRSKDRNKSPMESKRQNSNNWTENARNGKSSNSKYSDEQLDNELLKQLVLLQKNEKLTNKKSKHNKKQKAASSVSDTTNSGTSSKSSSLSSSKKYKKKQKSRKNEKKYKNKN